MILRGLFCTLMFLQTPAICLLQTGIGKQQDWFAKYRYRRMCTQKQETVAVVRD